MKRLLLTCAVFIAANDGLAKGFSAGRSSSFSAGRSSYSAPRSSSYSAPRSSSSGGRGFSSSPRSRYVAPPSTTPQRVPGSYRPYYAPTQNVTVIQQHQSSGLGGFWTVAALGWFGHSWFHNDDPPGMVCHGGGCSQRVCEPVGGVNQ